MENVKLPRVLVDQVVRQAQASPEVEVCGLMAAKHGRPSRCISVSNIADPPQRLFTMDPIQQIGAMRSMRDQDETLFGIYHSHPDSPAQPSATDLEQAAYPEALYLIVSLAGNDSPEIRGFRINHGEATEVCLDIVPPEGA